MKPNDLHLGVSELFSILIPGFLIVVVGMFVFDIAELATSSTNYWIIIAIASYIFGHVFFAIGSQWDKLYEYVKPSGNDSLLNTIEQIRSDFGQFSCQDINHYKWSRAALSKCHIEGYREVQRHEADSKLFRSLIIPLLVTFVFLSINQLWPFSLIVLGMAYIAFARYKEQRFKGCKLAYTQVIVLAQLGILMNK